MATVGILTISTKGAAGEREDASGEAVPLGSAAARTAAVATVERGRIASLAGIVTLIWLVILVLMIWNS